MNVFVRRACLLLACVTLSPGFSVSQTEEQGSQNHQFEKASEQEGHEPNPSFTDPDFLPCADEVMAEYYDRIHCTFCFGVYVTSGYQTLARVEFNGGVIHEYHLLGTDNTKGLSLGVNSSRLIQEYVTRMRYPSSAGSGKLGVLFGDAFDRPNYVDVWEVSWETGSDQVLHYTKKWLVSFCGSDKKNKSATPAPIGPSRKDSDQSREKQSKNHPNKNPGNATINMELADH